MYDNIKIIQYFINEEQRLRCFNELKKRVIRYNGNDKNYLFGYIKNMNLKITQNNLTIHGSIAKFLNGENCTPLKRKDVEIAIHQLEDEIGIELSNAIVKYVEFGPSFIVKENLGKYFNLFGWAPKLGKSIHFLNSRETATVTYKSKTGFQEFILYNKTEEMIKKGAKKKIPTNFTGQNVFRLEYKIKNIRGIREKFGRDLTLYDLFEKNIYQTFQKLFLEFYNSIEKYGRTIFVHKSETIRQYKDNFYELQRQIHPDEYNEYHREVKEAGKIPNRYFSAIRSNDRKRSKNFQISNTSPLIAELDALVQKAALSSD